MPIRFVSEVRRIAAVLISLGLLVACTQVQTAGPNAKTGNRWTHHGRLIYAQNQDAKTLNVFLSTDGSSGDLSMFLFSYAVRYDDHARPQPDALREIPTIANGDVSKDGLTLEYKLRPHILFHDGVQLTCRDLAFTWHVVMNPANNGTTQEGYRDIKSIDCSDPLVAVVHMKKIYAPFLQQLWGVNGNAPIFPEHLLAKVNDAKGSFNRDPYQAAPVGSGPFVFVRWDRGSQVVMRAFDKYFKGRPKLDEVIAKYVPDENTMVDQLRTHEIDMAIRIGASAFPEMHGISGTIEDALPAFTFDHVDFNLHNPLFANDVMLRRALATATNKAEIVAKLAHGQGDLTDTALSPKLSAAWTNDTAHYPFSASRARAMLEADGWHVGADGVRARDGVRLAFNLSTQTESTTGKSYQTLIQSEWRAIGADVSTKNFPTAQFFDNTTAGILQGGHYDVATFAWLGAADPDDSAIYSGHNLAPHGQNTMYWNDPVATAAMDGELTSVDPAVRHRDFIIEQQRFASDVPSIVLMYRRSPQAYNSDLKGYKPSPVLSPFWNPEEYSI